MSSKSSSAPTTSVASRSRARATACASAMEMWPSAVTSPASCQSGGSVWRVQSSRSRSASRSSRTRSVISPGSRPSLRMPWIDTRRNRASNDCVGGLPSVVVSSIRTPSLPNDEDVQNLVLAVCTTAEAEGADTGFLMRRTLKRFEVGGRLAPRIVDDLVQLRRDSLASVRVEAVELTAGAVG